MYPLVSICVPVYGVENYIERCCRSLFEQTYPNIEYIFVNDCTPDNSIDILERILLEYPTRVNNIRIYSHQVNRGLAGARNTAVEAASGVYLMHVDSDDYLDLNVVECLVNTALSENADVVQYDMRYVFSDKQYIVHQQIPASKIECVKNVLNFKMSGCVCGALYDVNLFHRSGVHFIEGLNFGEDYVTKPRILYYARKIVHCKECFYNYVQYNTSSYTLSYKQKNIDDLIEAISVLKKFFSSKQDYEIYKDDVELAHLYVKIKLLLAICLHRKDVWNNVSRVADLYTDKNPYIACLPLSYKLVLKLAHYKLYNLMYVYVNCGYWLKKIVK